MPEQQRKTQEPARCHRASSGLLLCAVLVAGWYVSPIKGLEFRVAGGRTVASPQWSEYLGARKLDLSHPSKKELLLYSWDAYEVALQDISGC
jgi:hypothetical protein